MEWRRCFQCQIICKLCRQLLNCNFDISHCADIFAFWNGERHQSNTPANCFRSQGNDEAIVSCARSMTPTVKSDNRQMTKSKQRRKKKKFGKIQMAINWRLSFFFKFHFRFRIAQVPDVVRYAIAQLFSSFFNSFGFVFRIHNST